MPSTKAERLKQIADALGIDPDTFRSADDPGPDVLDAFLRLSESRSLMDAMLRIGDADSRQRVVRLAQQIARERDPDVG